jgi:hypothetical protein
MQISVVYIFQSLGYVAWNNTVASFSVCKDQFEGLYLSNPIKLEPHLSIFSEHSYFIL